MKTYPIVEEHKYFLSIETELFYFDVYRAWHAVNDRAQDMFRVGVAIKKNDRKYHIFHELFAEWDYANKDVAFEESKKRLYEIIAEIGTQLLGIGNIPAIHDTPNPHKLEHDSLCEIETYKAGDEE